ncbi:MAG: K(+)-transporting ATPase subunit C [Cyclobacteriaceae bacterium]|nr:K(+)-transporting ATPase subunit C [Cyclobacteriaceae bacterium]
MKNYWISLRLTLVTVILFGVLYPLAITGVAKLIAPNSGRGKEVSVNNTVVGFELIGQKFDDPKYFNSRPSAVDYNAASTGGSNKGPSNPEYLAMVEERIRTFLKENPSVKKENIPVDLVTASGGGLDPHISPQAAYIQVERIARARNIPETKIIELVNSHVEKPLFNLFGTTTVHVLKLNIALDKLN